MKGSLTQFIDDPGSVRQPERSTDTFNGLRQIADAALTQPAWQLGLEGLTIASAGAALVVTKNPEIAGRVQELLASSARFTDALSFAGRKGEAAESLALPKLELNLPEGPLEAARDIKISATVDGIERALTVHLFEGFDKSKPNSVYYLLDGVQINNPAGNMLGINGWRASGDAHQVVTVSLDQSEEAAIKAWGMPLPEKAFGKPIPNVTSWSIEDGLLNRNPMVSDLRFFRVAKQGVETSMIVDQNILVGFSDGGNFANLIARKVDGIDGVATVAGSYPRNVSELPMPGIRGFFVNMELDPTIPIDGGAGPKLTRFLPWFGHRNIHNSAPLLQETRYAQANGFAREAEPTKIVDTPVFTSREYVPAGEDQAKVVAFRLKKGGHTWPGRATGDGTNTAVTKANGDTVPHSEFPTNDLIIRFFENGRRIQRSLVSSESDAIVAAAAR